MHGSRGGEKQTKVGASTSGSSTSEEAANPVRERGGTTLSSPVDKAWEELCNSPTHSVTAREKTQTKKENDTDIVTDSEDEEGGVDTNIYIGLQAQLGKVMGTTPERLRTRSLITTLTLTGGTRPWAPKEAGAERWSEPDKI